MFISTPVELETDVLNHFQELLSQLTTSADEVLHTQELLVETETNTKNPQAELLKLLLNSAELDPQSDEAEQEDPDAAQNYSAIPAAVPMVIPNTVTQKTDNIESSSSSIQPVDLNTSSYNLAAEEVQVSIVNQVPQRNYPEWSSQVNAAEKIVESAAENQEHAEVASFPQVEVGSAEFDFKNQSIDLEGFELVLEEEPVPMEWVEDNSVTHQFKLPQRLNTDVSEDVTLVPDQSSESVSLTSADLLLEPRLGKSDAIEITREISEQPVEMLILEQPDEASNNLELSETVWIDQAEDNIDSEMSPVVVEAAVNPVEVETVDRATNADNLEIDNPGSDAVKGFIPILESIPGQAELQLELPEQSSQEEPRLASAEQVSSSEAAAKIAEEIEPEQIHPAEQEPVFEPGTSDAFNLDLFPPAALESLNSVQGSDSAAVRTSQMVEPIITQIVEEISLRANAVEQEVQIRLKPEHLGALNIKLSLDQGVVRAEFMAENPLVGDLIQAALPQLRISLQQLGMNLGEVSVGLGFQDNSQQFSDNRQQQSPRRSRFYPEVNGSFESDFSSDSILQINLRV